MICRKTNGKIILSLCMAAIFFAAVFFSIPFDFNTYAYLENDFSSYEQKLAQMEKNYSSAENGVVYAESDDLSYFDRRIIVECDDKLNTMGATSWTGYNGLYTLQYATGDAAKKALAYYENLNLNAFYDFEFDANDVTVDGEYTEAEAASIFGYSSSTTFSSWGYSGTNDYMGVNSYLASMSSYSASDLNKIVVAVIDSGINATHNMFNGGSRVLTEYARDYTGSGSWVDDNGHGTHVSGTIAEVTPACVKILPLKVLDSTGRGSATSIVQAINWLMNIYNTLDESGYTLKVVNMSLGVTSSAVPSQTVTAFASAIGNKIDALYNTYGVICSVSAGNESQNTQSVEPANVASAITVSALTVNGAYNDTTSMSYANRYNTKLAFADYSNYGSAVDFCAPGTYIVSASYTSNSGYRVLSGTSMAAPHVAACLALYYVHPDHSNIELDDLVYGEGGLYEKADKTFLVTTGQYAFSTQRNNYYGYGCLNISEMGIQISGTVNFSQTNKFSNGSFSTSLTYSNPNGESYYRIYYKENDNSSSINPDDMTLYNSSSITRTSSTKLTAVAFVYTDSTRTKIKSRSVVSTMTYYVGRSVNGTMYYKDISSNYSISSGVLSSYYGTEVPNLELPSVTEIGESAFSSNSSIRNLLIPSTVTKIQKKAFYNASKGNSTLETVSYSGSGIIVGEYSFKNCKKLTTFDVANITQIDKLAFHCDSLLTTLNLPKVTTVGLNAFTQTGLREIYFGRFLSAIAIQSLSMSDNLVKGNVYGFNSIAEEFANLYAANYHDLSIKMIRDLGQKKYATNGGTVTYTVVVGGENVSYKEFTKTGDFSIGHSVISTGEYQKEFRITVSGIYSSGKFSVTFKDATGDTVTTAESDVIKLSPTPQAYIISAPVGNYLLYVDDDLVSSGYTVYKGVTYTIKIVSQDGYVVDDIIIDGHSVGENEEYLISPLSNVAISLSSELASDFTVYFNSIYGDIYVNGSKVGSTAQVDSNADLTFNIDGKLGYKVLRVNVDGELLVANDDGSYTIENITKNTVVDVIFEQASYKIVVSYVKGCANMITSGGLDDVAYGTKNFPITIDPRTGYVIDYVTVNGKLVNVSKDGTFVIESVDGDVDVEVSFRETKSIFAGENATIIYYFIVFGLLFALFVVARIVLFFVRKHQKEQNLQ